MSHLFDTPLTTGQAILLIVALVTACAFEFVNGFHDTANAVATVIYTRSLKPWYAVMLSGTCNFLGVYLGGIAVAMGIIKLLPVDLLVSSGSGAGLAMVLALLTAAIVWNLGTWYFGLPASSSHTLIGAIVGVGLANSLMPGHVFGTGVNWHKVQEIGMSLVLSPIVGLGVAALLMLLAARFLKSPALHTPPDPNKSPPWWIRAILVSTCSGVSVAHGSNDGQKGVGLLMLILIGLLPADFAVDRSMGHDRLAAIISNTDKIEMIASNLGPQPMIAGTRAATATSVPEEVQTDLEEIRQTLEGRNTMRDVPPDQRFELRSRILRVDSKLAGIEKTTPGALSKDQWASLDKERAALRATLDYAPSWVLVVVALSLGLGTMIGWKRIVVTVGEKIGKTHLTYSQGASAEIVAMTTIGLSSQLGLPVSTTHVLSSGIAGTMLAKKSGLQASTVRNIALAWVLTLPVATVLGGGLFILFRAILPDAKAATPAVQVDPRDEEGMVVAPAYDRPLRLHGSNTIGAELAPAIAEAFLRSRGASDVHHDKGIGEHGWVVSGTLPKSPKPVTIEIDASGTETAFQDLQTGAADVGMASRPMTAEEAERLQAAGAGNLTDRGNENVIGLDGIAVIVNAGNPSGPLTTDALAKMFDGETTTWPGTTTPIHVMGRDDRSGTYAMFRSFVLGDKALVSTATRFADGAQLEAAVAADPAAIGFVGMSSVHTTRALPISESGAAASVPTSFTVETEDYPLSRRLYLYSPSPRRHALAQDFLSFALSDAGQSVVAAKGFVALQAVVSGTTSACTGCTPAYADATRGMRRLSIDFRFNRNATDLDARGQRDLDRVVAALHGMRSPTVTLLGFSDSSGDPQTNVAVSAQRASAAEAELQARGIPLATVKGMGDAMPVGSNGTEEGRRRNRRVEVWISGT
jgi:PiT family inorganic phosphate transporter